jgi:hypothetical protein
MRGLPGEKPWPDGFVCPDCGCRKGWKLRGKPWVWECGSELATDKAFWSAAGNRPPSSQAPSCTRRTWRSGSGFWRSIQWRRTRMASPRWSCRPSLGIRSYKTAWLLLYKLRRAMVDPNRDPLGGEGEVVQVDETDLPFHRKTDPIGDGRGRSKVGKHRRRRR